MGFCPLNSADVGCSGTVTPPSLRPWYYIYFKNHWGYKLAVTSAGSPETCQHRWDIPWCYWCSPTSSVLCYHHCFPSSEWKLPGRHPSLVFSGSLVCIAQQSSHPGQTVRKFLQELLPINSSNWTKCQSNLLVTWSGRGDFLDGSIGWERQSHLPPAPHCRHQGVEEAEHIYCHAGRQSFWSGEGDVPVTAVFNLFNFTGKFSNLCNFAQIQSSQKAFARIISK